MSANDERALSLRDAALAGAQREITQTRERLLRSAVDLQRELARLVDWRQWVRRRPVTAVTFAFGLGLLLGRRS